MKKRIFSFFLATVMVVAMVPATLLAVFAEESSGRVINYTSAAVLDGKNTSGEYDGAETVLLNSYGNDTDGDKMRVVYTKNAIYVLVEVFDNTVVNYSDALTDGTTTAGSSNSDFVFLGFSVGNSFQGIKRVYRGGAGRIVFQPDGTYVDMTSGLSQMNGNVLEKYFAHVNNGANGYTFEAKFPVSEMSAEDQALYAAGQLEVRFTAGAQDGENKGTEFAVTYDGDIANRGWDGAAEDDYFTPAVATKYKAKNPSNYTPYSFNPVVEEEGYKVGCTAANISTDGVIDAAYLNSDKVEIKNLVVGESSETNGYAYMTYDKDYLYIAVYVNDSTDDGANDYVALTMDWLYDAELFATGASNYKKAAHWTAPSLYLGYSQAGRVLSNSGNTWHAWMFPGGIKPEVAYAAVENSTDYIVEWKIEWKGSAKTELLNADSFDFGAGIIIYDNGVEISSSEQTNATNKAFTGDMLPKFSTVNNSEAMYYTDVAYSSTSLVIDGEIDDKYRESTPIKIDQYVGGEGKNDLGNSVAYAAFTDDYLYVIIDVVDSTIFANGYYGSTTDGNVHEGAEIVVDFFRATATAEQMALDSAAYKTAAVNAKTAGYFRSAYKHNTESNKYGVYSWYNAWMFAEFNTVKTSAVKILEDGTGYRLEYRFAFDDATKAKIATGESCEIGLGFILRDDTKDDGTCYRYSVYKSCSPSNLAADPKGVTSYVVTKPKNQAVEPDQPNPDQPTPDQPTPDQPTPDQPNPEPIPTQPKISYSLISPLIDGELDDFYLGSTPIEINQYVGGEGQNDLGKSVAYAVISGNALYLLIDVKDSTVFADGYNGRASDDSVQEGAEVMIDFFRGSATEEQLALSGANYKKAAAEAGEIGYFKSTYKHNVDKNNYAALSFYNCWMYGDFATSGLGGAKVKILEDGTGYRLEYRLTLPESISSKISEMENGDSFEMGIGILLRDDTTDDGEVYRHSVYKSGSVATNDILATPSFTFVKEIPEITGANVSLGEDISVNYYVDGLAASMTPQMRFTMNGKKTTIDGVYNEELGKWCFKFENIAPQCMGDNIKAELLIENMVVASQYKYSVLENVTSEDVMNDENKQLVYDLLAYGAAAQIYMDHNADALVNEGYEELATQVTAIENSDRVIDAALSDAQFTAAGVYHDSINKLYVKFTADDISSVTVTVNGEAAEIKEFEDGYIVYTNNIKATDFDEVYTFVLTTANGSQTFTYSVNAYAKAKCDSENTATAALAKALYAYGCSAEQYNG